MSAPPAKLPRLITAQWLEEKGASCKAQLAIFRKLWPRGTPVTYRRILRALREGISFNSLAWLTWRAGRTVSRPYSKVRPRMWAAYHQATAPALRAYQEAMTTARDTHSQATRPARAAYRKASAAAWHTHQEAIAAPLLTYQKAVAIALAAAWQSATA